MRISCRPLNFSCFEGFWKPICRSQPLQYPTGCLESRSIPYQTANSNLFDLVWKSKNVWSKLRRVPMPQNIQWRTWRHSLEIGTQSAKSCVSVHLILSSSCLICSPLPVATLYLFDTLVPALFNDSPLLAWKRYRALLQETKMSSLPLSFILQSRLENKKLTPLANASCQFANLATRSTRCSTCSWQPWQALFTIQFTILISGPFPGSNRSRTRPRVAHTQSKVTKVPLIFFNLCNPLKMTPRKALLSCLHMLTHYAFHQQHSMLPTM